VRRPGHKTILLLLAVLVAVLVAGCGGGGGDETTETVATVEEPQKLSKAELIEQGDGICAETNAAVAALAGSETETSSTEQDEKVANLYTGMIEGLQELGAPEASETAYAEFMEAGEELAKVEGEVTLAAEREDVAALEEAKIESEPQLEEFQERATDYGFEDCSEGPGAVTPAGSGTGTSEPEAGEEAEGFEEEGGVEPEAEYVEPEYEEAPPEEEVAPETGGAGGGAEVAPEAAPETGGGSSSGGVGPG
jgi:head-tail adaptor